MVDKEKPRRLATISYSIYDDSTDVVIDAELDDYNDASINAISNILDIISSDSGVLNTINIIKDSLLAAGEEEALLILLTNIGQKIVANSQTRTSEKNIEDAPCILPSDML